VRCWGRWRLFLSIQCFVPTPQRRKHQLCIVSVPIIPCTKATLPCIGCALRLQVPSIKVSLPCKAGIHPYSECQGNHVYSPIAPTSSQAYSSYLLGFQRVFFMPRTRLSHGPLRKERKDRQSKKVKRASIPSVASFFPSFTSHLTTSHHKHFLKTNPPSTPHHHHHAICHTAPTRVYPRGG
jgi:hypothetical protein